MIHTYPRLALTLALSLLTAAAAAAQTPVTLIRVGDPVPGVGNVTDFDTYRVNGDGDWILQLETDNPDADRNEVIVRNGGLMVREGDAAPGLAGATFSYFGDFDVNDDSEVALVARVEGVGPGETGVLYFKGGPLLVAGDTVGSGGFAPGSTYAHFFNVHLNDSHQMLVVATVLEGPDIVIALMRFEVNALGQLVSETLLAREGAVPPGQGFPIVDLWTNTNAYSLNDSGDGVWSAILDPAADPHEYVTYFSTSNLIAQSATPSPVPGRDWADFLGAVPCDSNSAGSWVIEAALDSSDATNDRLILLDGSIFLREGDPFPALPGSDVVELVGGAWLTEAGEVVYHCLFDGFASDMDEGLFLGDTIVAREGLTQTFDNRVVTTVRHFGYVASDDGDFLMYEAVLDGVDEAVLLVERNIGEDYCSAELNSTGGTSFTVATGSTEVDFNSLRLWTYNVPVNQFGYYLTSTTQDDILHPGGSQGRLCLGGTIGRFVLQVQNSGQWGNFGIEVDLTAIPLTPSVAVQPGETWNFQAWHRDNNPNSTSNFSRPVSITFR